MSAKSSSFTAIVSSILIVLSWPTLLHLTPAAGAIAQVEPKQLELAGFRLISASDGWLRLGQHLYWTRDSGQSWTEITPPTLGQSTLQTVEFVDARSGWLVSTQLEASGAVAYNLTQTSDGGATWRVTPLSLFARGDPDALAEATYLHFVDAQTGWLVVKRATSSNFSVGTLFKTTDGGQNWTELALPIGEPVYFVTPDLGWVAGGPAGDQLYRTQDGGQSWQAQPVGQVKLKPDEHLLYRLPTFADDKNGVLPVIVTNGVNARVEFYLTADGGNSWSLARTESLRREVTAGTVVSLAVLDTRRWLLIAPQSDRLLSLSANTSAARSISQGNWVKGIIELDMVSPSVGWASYGSGSCTTEPGQNAPAVIRCTQETRLLRTTDGGQTWTPLLLPGLDAVGAKRDRMVVESVTLSGEKQGDHSMTGQALGDHTGIFIGQGFDKCEIASPSQLQTWLAASPYRIVNLYIGGSSRYCANAALSAALLAQLSQQGWQFIPTWVGPQAACTTYTSRISYDLDTAYNQGLAEANGALEVAANLGLTLADQSGAIIYYDLEYYEYTNTACHNAAKAFIAGWTAQLRGTGNHAGVYSTGPILNGFAGIPNVPDAIWPAHWINTYYNPDATVWDVYNLSNSLWNNQQRIRQYTGGHNETWGGLTLNIDSDVSEGIAASLRRERVYLPLIMLGFEAPPPAE
jgi:photosystem II stability/assembly factor-like uncharacterized protein